MYMKKTPVGQTFKPEDMPGTQESPRTFEDDAGEKPTNLIRGLVAKAMNKEMLLCGSTAFLKEYGPVDVKPLDVQSCITFLLKKKLLIKMPSGNLRWTSYTRNPSVMGKQDKESEPVVFAHLGEIVDSIFTYAAKTKRGRGNDYFFKLVPYGYLSGDVGGTNHKMDACIIEEEYTGPLPVRNGIVPQEYKLKWDVVDQIKVREQIVGNCQHILAEDPRRMFVYAITIEDTRMSVWYFSRSHSVKAFAFDWVEQDINKFIHLFLAFAYATPQELGIDPFVHKAPCNIALQEAQQYIYQCPVEWDLPEVDPKAVIEDSSDIIEVQCDSDTRRKSSRMMAAQAAAVKAAGDAKRAAARRWAAKRTPISFKYFKTVQAIAAMRPLCISGRTTRIWKVIEVDSIEEGNEVVGAQPVILKDIWLDEKRSTEAENMDEIFKDLEKVLQSARRKYPGDNWMTQFMEGDARFAAFDMETKDRLAALLTDGNYKSLFLTKLHAWKGQVSKKTSKSAKVPKEDVFCQQPPMVVEPADATRAPYGTGQTATGGQPLAQADAPVDKNPRASRLYASKQQSRFIYKEVCSSLWDLGNMGNFMDVIEKALDALKILFCAGWVHRDISSGNLLSFKPQGSTSWNIKLSDLEFSEKLGHSDHRADPLTGTPYYMSYELMNRTHMINLRRRKANPANDALSLAGHLKLKVGSEDYNRLKYFKKIEGFTTLPSNATDDIPSIDDPVRYNYQHDLESIWWLVLYAITACVFYEPSNTCAKMIFKTSFDCSLTRGLCFLQSLSLNAGRYVHPNLESIVDLLEGLREPLIESYEAIEVFGQRNIDEAYSGIHGLFATSFRALMRHNELGWKKFPIVASRRL